MSVFATRLTTTRNCSFVRNSALSSGAIDYVSCILTTAVFGIITANAMVKCVQVAGLPLLLVPALTLRVIT